MTELETAVGILFDLRKPLQEAHKTLEDITSRNQNPGCGGDRLMSPTQWECLRDVGAALKFVLELEDVLGTPHSEPLLKTFDENRVPPDFLAQQIAAGEISAAESDTVYAKIAQNVQELSSVADASLCFYAAAPDQTSGDDDVSDPLAPPADQNQSQTAPDDLPTLVSIEADGTNVYALLSDDTILRSPPLDDSKCAELHAEQVKDLKLTVEALVMLHGWEEVPPPSEASL